MPKYKNQFIAPAYFEETIIDEGGNTIGTIRVKPSSVLWKPGGQRQFYTVSLNQFADWIISPTAKARRTKS